MTSFLVFGLGAAAMYLLDPKHGRRRRAALRGGKREQAGHEDDVEADAFDEGEIGIGGTPEEPVISKAAPAPLPDAVVDPKAAPRYSGAERRKDRNPYRSAERRASASF